METLVSIFPRLVGILLLILFIFKEIGAWDETTQQTPSSKLSFRRKEENIDKGIGFKPKIKTTTRPEPGRGIDQSTTDYPFSFEVDSTYRTQPGARMILLAPNLDTREVDNYYDNYDFEFAKSGVDYANFLKYYMSWKKMAPKSTEKPNK